MVSIRDYKPLSRGEAVRQVLFFAYMVFKQLLIYIYIYTFYFLFILFLISKVYIEISQNIWISGFSWKSFHMIKTGYCQKVAASLRWSILLCTLPQSLLLSIIFLTPRTNCRFCHTCLTISKKLRVGYLLYSCSHWKWKKIYLFTASLFYSFIDIFPTLHLYEFANPVLFWFYKDKNQKLWIELN